MTLMRRTRTEPAWPEWFTTRSLLDWPELPRLLEEDRLKVEEFRDGDTLVIRAEMPGIDPEEDVEITVTDGVLRISAERTEKNQTEETKGFRSEFRYGSFTRTMTLPAGATEDDIVADYTDGILEIRVPISDEKATARKVKVGHG